jgi:hypothetical protein
MLVAMRAFSVTATAALLLLLGGCAASPPETSPASPEPVDGDSTTVAQWASLVAEQQLELNDWYDKWEENSCSALSLDYLPCSIQLTSGSYIAQTNHIVIWGPSDPASKTYIGEPPAEIARLYADTIAATEAAYDAGVAWGDEGCSLDVTDACIDIAVELERGLEATRSKFAAWEPYL